METLRFSSTGVNVQILQLALIRAGFLDYPIDGIFGNKTLNAVKAFQRANGLTPDGIVGNKTWNALYRYLRGYTQHRVVRGDTYYSLAREYGSTPEAIATANPTVTPGNLRIGTVLTIPYSFDVTATDISYSSKLLEFIVEGIKARYPFVIKGEIGKSVMGKPLYYLAAGVGRRKLFINAAHHANEWITTPLTLKYFEDYAKAVAANGSINGQRASELYNTTTLYLVPMVNPDGVDLVTGVLNSGRYYERARGYANNYPSIPFPSGWKANIDGVDLNLQYPADWEEAKRIKYALGFTSPAPRDFVGSAPLSAKESKAVYDFTNRQNFLLILAYHTQGNIIYWKYKDLQPERSFEIGVKLSEASGYPLSSTPYESGNAGYKDWFILQFNRPGYTIEAGIGENPLPISQFGTMYKANSPLMTAATEATSTL